MKKIIKTIVIMILLNNVNVLSKNISKQAAISILTNILNQNLTIRLNQKEELEKKIDKKIKILIDKSKLKLKKNIILQKNNIRLFDGLTKTNQKK